MKYSPILLFSILLAACAPTQQVYAISTTKPAGLITKLSTISPAAFSPDGRYVVSYERFGSCSGLEILDTKTNIVTASMCLGSVPNFLEYSDDGKKILVANVQWGYVLTADKLEVVGQHFEGGYAESVVYTGTTWVTSDNTFDASTGSKLMGLPKQDGAPTFSFLQDNQVYTVRQDDETVRIYPAQSKEPTYSTPGRFSGYFDGTLLVKQGRKLIAQRPFTNETLNVFDLDEGDHVDSYERYNSLHLPMSALMGPDLLVYLSDADSGTNVMALNLKTGENTFVKTTETTTCVIPDRANNRVALCRTGELVVLPTTR